MNEQLKRCSICGSPAEKMWDLQEKLVRCTNRTCHNSLYSVYLNEWQSRPIEDELLSRIERAKDLLQEKLGEWLSVSVVYLPDHYLQLRQVLDVLEGGGE